MGLDGDTASEAAFLANEAALSAEHARLTEGFPEKSDRSGSPTLPEVIGETALLAAGISSEDEQGSEPKRLLTPDDLTQLYNTHEYQLFNFIYRIIHDQETAHDLTQEVFFRATRRLHAARPSKVTTRLARPWLYRIATNLAIDQLRRQKLIAFSAYENENGDSMAAPGKPFDDQIVQRAEIAEVLDAMPAMYRSALVLRYYLGFKSEEIAQKFGLVSTGGKMLLSRARKAYREAYRKLSGTTEN